ncbi:hypothetical protein R1flu_004473 [Riccia fluitans]|uniref:Uncharacterized protein n=1 Tax=Riccia fluitans TaxID=41844 RepID=A0ABD1YTA8_9MARC
MVGRGRRHQEAEHLEPSTQSFPALVCIGASQSDVGVNNNVQGSVARVNFLPCRDFINGNRCGPTGRFSNGKILPDLLGGSFRAHSKCSG